MACWLSLRCVPFAAHIAGDGITGLRCTGQMQDNASTVCSRLGRRSLLGWKQPEHKLFGSQHRMSVCSERAAFKRNAWAILYEYFCPETGSISCDRRASLAGAALAHASGSVGAL